MAITAAQLSAVISIQNADKAKSDLQGVSRAVDATGSAMKVGLLGMGIAAGAALIGIGVKSTQMAADFQQSLLKVGAYAGLSKTQMDSMSNSILDMATKVGQSPKQLADAIYPIISSGYGAADALSILNLSAKTAAASGAQTSVVADALTTSLGAMHAPASKAAQYMDMLNRMVSIGKGEVPQYAAVIGKLSLAAAGAGVDFATSGAALADLTTHGFPSVAQASTSLQNLFTQIGIKTDALTQHAKKLGLAFDAQKFASMGLSDKLDYLQKITGGNQGELLKLVGGSKVALQAFDALEGSTGDLRKNLDAMMHSTGATDAAFKTASSGLNASMDRLKATFQVGLIEIGQRLLPLATQGVNLLNTAFQNIGPIVQGIAQYFSKFDLKPIAAAWKELSGAVQDALKPLEGANGVFKTMSPFLLELRDDFTNLVGAGIRGVTGIISGIAQSIQSFSKGGGLSSIGDMFKQLGPPIQNIASLLKGEFSKEFKDLVTDAQQLGQWFQTAVVPALKQALPGFLDLGRTILTTVIPAAIQIRGVLADVIQHALQKLGPIIGEIIPPLIVFAGLLAKTVSGALQFLMPYVLQATKAIGDFASEIIDRVAPIITNFISDITPLLKQFASWWNSNWPAMSQILLGVWNIIVGIVKVAWSLVSGIVLIGLDIMGGNWKQAWTDMQNMLSGIWSGIQNILSGAWGIIKVLFAGWINDATNAGASIVKGIAAGISGAVHWVSDAITNVTSFISSHLPHSPAKLGPLRDLVLQGGMITEQLSQGMLSNMPKLNAALGQLVKPISMTLSPAGALPAGTTGVPASVSSQGQTIVINVKPPDIVLDGQRFASAILPGMVSQIRHGTGNWSM